MLILITNLFIFKVSSVVNDVTQQLNLSQYPRKKKLRKILVRD